MRRLLFLALIALCPTPAFSQQVWTAQASGTSHDLYGVSLIDSMNGTAVANDGTIVHTGSVGTVGMREIQVASPRASLLEQSVPNPACRQTTFGFRIERAAPVLLEVLDMRGSTIAVLVDRPMEPGSYKMVFEIEDRRAGVYYYRLRSGDVIETKQLIVVR